MPYKLLMLTALAMVYSFPAQSQICDLNGNWSITNTELQENCGDGLDPPFTFSAPIIQFGPDVTIFAPSPSGSSIVIDGVISGSILSLTWSEPEDGGVTSYSGDISIAPSCASISGTVNWEFDDGFFQCSGQDQVSAVFLP